MTDQLSFKVSKKDHKPITFDLEGNDHVYTFQPSKVASAVLPMLEADGDFEAAKVGFEWLDEGLSEEDQNHLSARLLDKKDDLDIPDLEDVISGLMEATGGRPTT
jgi:hypothetical protein